MYALRGEFLFPLHEEETHRLKQFPFFVPSGDGSVPWELRTVFFLVFFFSGPGSVHKERPENQGLTENTTKQDTHKPKS